MKEFLEASRKEQARLLYSYGFLSIYCLIPRYNFLRKKKMAQHKLSPIRKKRYEAYENLMSSLDTENDINDITLENLTNLEFNR